MVIEIPTLESQYFDIIWGFPQVDFGVKKTKGQEIGPGWIAMQSSKDDSNGGPAIDLSKDNPNCRH